jgi:hypothetical protein
MYRIAEAGSLSACISHPFPWVVARIALASQHKTFTAQRLGIQCRVLAACGEDASESQVALGLAVTTTWVEQAATLHFTTDHSRFRTRAPATSD